MSCFRFALCLAAMSLAASAQSPFIGVWKQNFDKSLGSSPEGLAAAVVRIEHAGENRVRISHEFVMKDGARRTTVGVFVLDGSDTTLTGNRPKGYTQALRPVSNSVWERVQKTKGQIHGRGYFAVSSDEKTLVITNFGQNEKGEEHYFHRVLERQ